MKPVRRSIGFFLLLDGIGALWAPAEYVRRLELGNPLIDDMLEYLAENPSLVRKFKIAEIAMGLWWVLR
ncbi:MAG TPA: hypothetical protein VH601_01695 [Bryobacteraceae bacterium]